MVVWWSRVGLGVLVLLAAACEARAADVIVGQDIVERTCAVCHVAGGDKGSDAAPPLETIAKRQPADLGWIRAWLADPHPPMPNPNLTRQEIDDVVLYLQYLAKN